MFVNFKRVVQCDIDNRMDEEVGLVKNLLSDSCYKVQGKLSEGAYGQVYKGVHLETNQSYALKLIDMERISKLNKLHQVLVQTKTLEKMNHPGVVKLIESFRRGSYMIIVLELGPFGDMFSFINMIHSHPHLHQKKQKIVTYYLAQALEVIDYIHSLGILHRDIKPQNFVLGSDLRLRLIDFATTYVLDQTNLFSIQQNLELELKSHYGQSKEGLVGSANYLSPQSLKKQYSKKGDIWAFGVMAYKFFLNKLPFEGSNEFEVFRSIIQDEIDLSKVDPQAEELLVLCLKKDPEQRPSAKMLKMCTIFKNINFKDIFLLPPPLSLTDLPQHKNQNFGIVLELAVEKKMFFGNFKPRLLTIAKNLQGLLMAYRYVDTRKIKKEFKLGLNDYASVLSDRQFQVVTKGNIYIFRTLPGEGAEQAVNQINALIKSAYSLQ